MMKSRFVVLFILFGPLVTISQGNRRRRTITMQHADIPRQFRTREVPDGETFAVQEIGNKVCRLVFASDTYEAVNPNTSVEPMPNHFPARNIAAMLTETVEVQKLTYNHDGTKVQIEVIECGRRDGKILYIENACDKNNFYVFEKSLSSDDAPPLIHRAMKNPEILANIQYIAECAERNGVRTLSPNNYTRLRRLESGFQSSYTSVGGTMEFAPFVFCSVICLSILIPVSAAPSRRSTDHEENINRKELLHYEKQLEDKDVLELKNLKSPKSSSTTTTKFQKTFYTNANGGKEENAQSTKRISNDGELMERIRQNVRTKQEFGSSHPKTHVITEIEIPPKGIRKLYEEDVPRLRELTKKNIESRYRYADNRKPDNVLQNFDDVVRYQPEEMAEYIFETGDEKLVTNTIETYLQLGVITREEALWYLKQIKALLSMLEEQEIRDKKEEQSRFYENLYSSPKSRINMNQALLDFRDVQHLVQDKYMKQFPEDNNVNYRYNSDEPDSEEADAFETEFERAEYRNLAEKLQNFDSLFSKASMEGVIYQLAKILFYQSFSMNGFEAQQPIKQFTTFLDRQVEEGHISRNMERKVFDILLSALTDTLDEHPELIGQKDADQNQKITKPQPDSLKHTIEKKSGNSKKTSYHATKSTNLKSSGILDEPKKPGPKK